MANSKPIDIQTFMQPLDENGVSCGLKVAKHEVTLLDALDKLTTDLAALRFVTEALDRAYWRLMKCRRLGANAMHIAIASFDAMTAKVATSIFACQQSATDAIASYKATIASYNDVYNTFVSVSSVDLSLLNIDTMAEVCRQCDELVLWRSADSYDLAVRLARADDTFSMLKEIRDNLNFALPLDADMSEYNADLSDSEETLSCAMSLGSDTIATFSSLIETIDASENAASDAKNATAGICDRLTKDFSDQCWCDENATAPQTKKDADEYAEYCAQQPLVDIPADELWHGDVNGELWKGDYDYPDMIVEGDWVLV